MISFSFFIKSINLLFLKINAEIAIRLSRTQTFIILNQSALAHFILGDQLLSEENGLISDFKLINKMI